MKSADYWQKRAEQVGDLQHAKAGQYTRTLYKEYDRAKRSIQRDIEVFYGRYATNNGISLAEARKQLSTGELQEFKMTLEEFIDKAKHNKDGKWTKQLNNVYYRTRVTRLEALELQITNQIRMLAHGQEQGLSGLLGDVYKDTYYRSLFEIQKGLGIGVSFAKIDAEAIERVVKTPWASGNYSTRVWGNTEKLASQLSTTLSQSLASGRSTAQTSALLAKRMDVSFSAAEALINTETAYIVTEATFDGYKESGVVKKYQYVATLSERTCPTCGSMDGRTFKLSEKAIGINAAPLHPRCRCTTVASFPDDEDAGKRIAKEQDGKTYYVLGDITYEQWKKKYVDAKHDILDVKGDFKTTLAKTPNMTPEYKDALMTRFEKSPEEMKRVFNKYVAGNVIDSTTTRNAHYNPITQSINMRFADDFKNPRGSGATYFHEHGHYVDNMAAIRVSGKQTVGGVSHMDIGDVVQGEYRQAILNDIQNFLDQYAHEKDITVRKAQQEIRDIFSQNDSALYSSISDVYGGATGNRLRGHYGHSKEYWKQLPFALEKEAFAHMFEASFAPTGKRLELIMEYLPGSYKVFKRILEAI